MGGVIAIDPGKRSGVALFRRALLADDWRLVEALTMIEREILERPRQLLGDVLVVIELPVIYPTRKTPPADLIDLAVMVGDLRGFYRRHGFEVRLVTPRNWKGTVPKSIHNKRTLAALTPEERALLPRRPRARDYDHNMLDAVGLGLWGTKRT